jgi:hypothetical protein
MMNMSEYGHLLTDSDVRRWHDSPAASSPVTAEVCLRTLGHYCDLAHTSPKQTFEDGPTRRFRDCFTDFGK